MINSAGTRTISTMGFNPVFHTENKIYQELQEAFDGGVDANEATQVYYYGAGCWDENLKGIVNNALSRIFFNANIAVEHDLLGAYWQPVEMNLVLPASWVPVPIPASTMVLTLRTT